MAAEAVDLAARPASMSKPEAKRLTAQIKRQLGDVQQRSERLAEAVRRAQRENAWAALGYASWRQYLDAEFPDLTRGQQYRLVAWGEITGELEAAAGGPVEVSGRQAVKVKKAGPSTVGAKVREALADKPDATAQDRKAAVESALAEPIEATATKVPGPVPAAQGVPTPPTPAADPAPDITVHGNGNVGDEAAAAARRVADAIVSRARATGGTWGEPSAAALLDALLEVEPDAAAGHGVAVEQLDRLMGWIGRVRVAIRAQAPQPERKAPPTPVKPPEPAAAKKKKAAPPSPKASECKHPVNQRIGGVCVPCGAKVG